MKVAACVALFVSSGHSFAPAARPFQTRHASLQSTPSSSGDDAERIKEMKKILAEESMNPANFKESADRMKSMTPGDMDGLMKEMEEMSSEQQAQLKAMGMDPTLMKKSMQMMRDNPAMMQNVGKMMDSMTPEQLVEQSLAAQEQMAKMPTELVDQAVDAVNTVSQEEAATDVVIESVQDAEIETNDDDTEEDDDDEENDEDDEDYEPVAGSSVDPAVVDSMFNVAELMSMPPNGGVTLQGFSSLPPITLLSGNRDVDLSKKELSECWLDGSLGATRVDRAGFERVWKEVQEYFEDDIMEEARKMSTGKSKLASAATSISNNPVVGASISTEQLQDQVKNMKDSDMAAMLDQMNEMTPEQEARMRAMGVDPAMMQKTANMMKSNPLLRKAATTMMKNMSPEQMMKASQQAQEKMGDMSEEDYEKAMGMMNKEQK